MALITVDIQNEQVDIVVREDEVGISIEINDMAITMTHAQASDIYDRLNPWFGNE